MKKYQILQLHYDPDLNVTGSVELPFVFTMNEEESWHCSKVLRMRAGEIIFITNGKGILFRGALISPTPKGCAVEIQEVTIHQQRNYGIHLAVAPIKNMSRYEWFLEKATELGCDEITPLLCEHSEKITVRTERLNKIVTTAMKQSLCVFRPVVHEPVQLNKFIDQVQVPGKFIGWCEPNDTPLLSAVVKPGLNTLVLIGPEGDFSHEEVEKAKILDFIPISLGKNRLRTETAALAACFSVHFANRMM
ncbi:MAG: 16S rRNA (uracil(1498)-N(3))-methyltransferase [Bacteroidales bacterium]|nr:16S rRNA (uracil(1498)-N(3))-methyltransferase [Bacteroidales bacterium]